MSFEFLSIKRDSEIAYVTLCRPECGNALNLSLMREITEAANSFKYDTETRVIVFKGEGKHFCVGADLKDEERWKAGESGDLLIKSRLTQIGRDLIEAVLGINQITIASLHGAAAGGGGAKSFVEEDLVTGRGEVWVGDRAAARRGRSHGTRS